MKRFILFGGVPYYPSGGWGDSIMDSDCIDDLIRKALEADDSGYYWEYQWAHIVDSSVLKIVWETTCDCDGENRETEEHKL